MVSASFTLGLSSPAPGSPFRSLAASRTSWVACCSGLALAEELSPHTTKGYRLGCSCWCRLCRRFRKVHHLEESLAAGEG